MAAKSYLIIARYNHEKYEVLNKKESKKDLKDFYMTRSEDYLDAMGLKNGEKPKVRHEAQDLAAKLFGVPTDGIDLDPEQSLENFFTFVDAFEHYEIPDDAIYEAGPKPTLRDRLIGSIRYGWVGLVPANKLDDLKEKIGWPDHPFCSVFDIEIIPLQGDFAKYSQNGDTGRYTRQASDDWGKLGLAIYIHQTPASWKK